MSSSRASISRITNSTHSLSLSLSLSLSIFPRPRTYINNSRARHRLPLICLFTHPSPNNHTTCLTSVVPFSENCQNLSTSLPLLTPRITCIIFCVILYMYSVVNRNTELRKRLLEARQESICRFRIYSSSMAFSSYNAREIALSAKRLRGKRVRQLVYEVQIRVYTNITADT